jgi:TrmH RNA methyltransferase
MPRRMPSPPRRPPSSAARPHEPHEAVEIVHGLRAGLAVLEQRRDDIVRVSHARATWQQSPELRRWATSCHVSCVEMADADLDRFAESTHHEGLCVVTRPRRWLSSADLGDAILRGGGTALALDRVRNPYNVGAMIRTAAFFGVDAALLGAPAPHPGLAPAAVRVAQGGVERVKLARTTDLAETLTRLRARGVRVIGADARSSTTVGGFVFRRPVLLVMGNEREGLGERVRAQCDALVAVRGSGAVESLNVAVAAGVILAAMARDPSGARDG